MKLPNDVVTYIASLTPDRQNAVTKLINVFATHMPKGFQLCINYNAPSFVVPHSLYPAGYHCKPSLPLPCVSIVSQKSGISLHHMGLYASAEMLLAFKEDYKANSPYKLTMGKGCIKYTNVAQIPYEVLERLATKLTVAQWIEQYEKSFKKNSSK